VCAWDLRFDARVNFLSHTSHLNVFCAYVGLESDFDGWGLVVGFALEGFLCDFIKGPEPYNLLAIVLTNQ